MTSPSCLRILCSGELGLTHDAQTIAHATVWLADDPRFSLTFVGGGAWWEALKRIYSALLTSNFKFESAKDASALSEHLASCDIGLVTQCPAKLGPSVPGMTYAFMAAARPILFIGPREAAAARSIERFRCGWRVEPGDEAGLLLLLEILAAQPELVREAGRRAYAAFQQHYFFVPNRDHQPPVTANLGQ